MMLLEDKTVFHQTVPSITTTASKVNKIQRTWPYHYFSSIILCGHRKLTFQNWTGGSDITVNVFMVVIGRFSSLSTLTFYTFMFSWWRLFKTFDRSRLPVVNLLEFPLCNVVNPRLFGMYLKVDCCEGYQEKNSLDYGTEHTILVTTWCDCFEDTILNVRDGESGFGEL